MIDNCPCGSKKLFSACCEPYLNGDKNAGIPEYLMRSRYTAYSLARMDYIVRTMQKKASENFDATAAKEWATSVVWLGLTVIDSSAPSENSGTVTFFARLSDHGVNKFIYEKSNFEKINSIWFYVDGDTPKINRNDSCPCGSGKKFKRCCLE